MAAELIVVSGPLSGSRYLLTDRVLEIGRSPSATIVVPDAEAARHHCLIEREQHGFRLTDLHTGSGTYLNGMRVASHALENGDQITVGDTVLVFRDGLQQGEGPLAARVTLLRACTLLFLFKGMATSSSQTQTDLLEVHALSLI